MKKLKIIFLFLILFLFSCDITGYDLIYDEVIIEYQENDNQDNVTKDIIIPKIDNVDYSSSNENYLKIEDYKGIITRPKDNDVKVNLIITITLNNIPKIYYKELNIIKEEESFLEPLYTITFDTNGGTKVDDLLVYEEDEIKEPNEPSKENFIFAGWYKDIELKNKFEFEGEEINSNLLLFAKWELDLKINTLYEDFYDITIPGNKYSTDTYNSWNLTNIMKKELNDKALQLKQEEGKIEKNFTNGISYLLFNYKQPNTTVSKLNILINNEIIDTITTNTQNKLETYSKEINIKDNYTITFESVGKGAITIDDILIKDNNYDTKLLEIYNKFNNLKIDNYYEENKEIELINNIDNNPIDYKYKYENDLNNQYFDIVNNKVILKENEIVNIAITISLTYLDITFSKDVIITIGQPTKVTIDEFLNKQDNTYNIIEGIITNTFIKDNKTYFFIEDNTNALLGIIDNSNELIKKGNKVSFKGLKETISNGIIITNLTNITKISEDNTITPLEDITNIENYLNKYIKIEGLLLEDNKLINNKLIYEIYNPFDEINNLDKGTKIILNANVFYENNKYYLLINNSDEIISTEYNKELIKKEILNNFSMPSNKNYLTDDLIFQTDLLFNSTVTYTSSNEDILSNTGLITRTGKKEEVTITYIITLNDEELYQNQIIYTISPIETYQGYYKQVTNQTGDELRDLLNEIISKDQILYDYDKATETAILTDQDPDNPDNIILLYTGRSVSGKWDGGKTWNREHVWAKSIGDFGTEVGPGTDLHHLKPADPRVNSTRNSRYYNEISSQFKYALDKLDNVTSNKYSDTEWSFEPRDEVKGDVARMIFYMDIRYEGKDEYPNLEIVEGPVQKTKEPKFGVLSVLLKWHKQDPVDDFERKRNEQIYKIQNNRNPFIDHPEFVSKIYEEDDNVERKTLYKEIYLERKQKYCLNFI